MYDFLLQIIVFLSLGFLIYLLARALPRLPEEAAVDGRRDYFGRLVKKLPLERVDVFLNMFFGKALRRMRIMVLKVDNLLNRYLSKVKKSEDKVNGENKNPLR